MRQMTHIFLQITNKTNGNLLIFIEIFARLNLYIYYLIINSIKSPRIYFFANDIFIACEGVILKPCRASFAAPD